MIITIYVITTITTTTDTTTATTTNNNNNSTSTTDNNNNDIITITIAISRRATARSPSGQPRIINYYYQLAISINSY